jgi:hypothetical protein
VTKPPHLFGQLCHLGRGRAAFHSLAISSGCVNQVLGLLLTQLFLSQDGAMGPWAVGHTGYLQMKAAK